MTSSGGTGPEKRGHLVSEGNNERHWLFLRRGALRIFAAPSGEGERRSSVPEVVLLMDRCDCASLPSSTGFEIRQKEPSVGSFAFRASSSAEADEWLDALQLSSQLARSRSKARLDFLNEGSTVYKYNYSNSKRMRRHFWIDADKVELCWAKTRSEEPQTMDLKDCIGIIFGPQTSTFQRCPMLEDLPWCCFSLLFSDRTLDLAVPPHLVEQWFLGMQSLLLEMSPGCTVFLTEAQLVVRRCFQKLKDSAQRQGLTTRTLVLQDLRTLGANPGIKEALEKAAKGIMIPVPVTRTAEDLEAEAKAERRRKRAESKAAEGGVTPAGDSTGRSSLKVPGSTIFSPPAREGGSALTPAASPTSSPGAGGSAAGAQPGGLEAEEQELQILVAELEKGLQAAFKRFEGLRPAWGELGEGFRSLDTLKEVLKSDSVKWQAEKCSESEKELVTLRTASVVLQRQLQAGEKVEKQLKKLAKQYKETEAQVLAMQEELSSAEAGVTQSEAAKIQSTAALEKTEVATSHLERRLKELQQQLKEADKGEELQLLQKQNAEQAKELEKLESEKATLKNSLQALKNDLQAVEQQWQENERKLQATSTISRRLGAALRKMQGDVGGIQVDQKRIRDECELQLRTLADSFPSITSAVQRAGASVDHMEERYREVCEEKRKLHNLILELKGNIRVFVRVRPMNEKEKAAEPAGEQTITFAEDCKVSVFESGHGRRRCFDFDKAFGPKTSQEDVFEEVKPLATSVLDGYNVCIFAYGQTGSGKTFTMTGSDSHPGLNVRVLRELFRIRAERMSEMDISITLTITEIYNETIKDLFLTKQKKLDVKTNPDGTNTVPGLTELEVNSVEDVLKAMKDAQSNRTVMATEMNEESSRSHSIVQVRTLNVSKKDKRAYVGKINLIDLAGSENVNKSGVVDQGMREAQNINKSLAALGNVIQNLCAKSAHIPYRDSKLTMMLKDSLGGDSKTLMIVQASPAQINVTETLSSLTFAGRARNVELGKAKRNVKGGEASPT